MTEEQRLSLGTYRAIIMDILDTASGAADRASERFEGTPEVFLFNDVRQAIAGFRDNHPTMKALGAAYVSHDGLVRAMDRETEHSVTIAQQRAWLDAIAVGVHPSLGREVSPAAFAALTAYRAQREGEKTE